jgi:hypothetical protein
MAIIAYEYWLLSGIDFMVENISRWCRTIARGNEKASVLDNQCTAAPEG